MRVFAVFCAVRILSACATETVVTQNPTPVHSSKWKTQKYRVSGENTGRLIINRDTGLAGSACIPEISLDGEPIAPINKGEKLELHLNAGQHILRASPNQNCTANVAETRIEITEAKTTTYRFGFSNRVMLFTPTAY